MNSLARSCAGLLAAALLPLLVPSCANAQPAPPWQLGVARVYDVSLLQPGRFAPPFAADLAKQTQNLETPVVAEHPYGDLGGLVLKQPLPVGRYRADFSVGADPYNAGDLWADVEVELTGAPKLSFRSRITPLDFPAEGFVEKSVDFYVPPAPVTQVTVKPTYEGHPKATAFRLQQISLTPLSGPLFLAGAMPDKVLYSPGEAGHVTATVINGGDGAANVTLQLIEETLLGERSTLGRQQVQLAAGETREVPLPFVAGSREYGRRFIVQLLQGDKVIDSAGDVAAVTTNLWNVAQGAVQNGVLQNTGLATQATIDAWARQARNTYCNWFEKDFWAPDDWGMMTPTKDQWLSGQATRHENLAMLKSLIAVAHRNGVRAITYGKGVSGGPSGLDLERRRPDWFMKDKLGVPLGRPVDVWDYDHWDDVDFHLANYRKFKSTWFYMVPDLRRLDTLDYGIDQLIASSREFGWDGVRFDGQFTAGNDAMSTRNMQRMKHKLLAAFPHYVFGYNIGGPDQFISGIPHELREAAAGGAQWMNEGINQWINSGGRRYVSWRDYFSKENDNATVVRRLGGSYHFIYGLQSAPALQSFYKFALGTIAGAHPDYGAQTMVPGCENWGKFLTRYSVLVWHPGLRALPAAQAVAVVSTNDAVWPVASNELVLDGTRRLAITHLVVKPPSDSIPDDTPHALPLISGCKLQVRVPDGQKLSGLYLVQPDSLQAQRLEVGAGGTVNLPVLQPWVMVVADLRGQFTPAATSPDFTAAPDPAQLKLAQEQAAKGAAGKVSAADPLRPAENRNTDADRWFSESEGVLWSAHQTPRLDTEASGGQAASYDKQMGSGVMAGYFSDLVPGRYLVTAHIKVVNPSPQTTILFHAYAETARGGARQTLKATDFGNGYRDVSLSVSYYGNEFIRIFVQGGVTGNDEVVYLDWTRLTLQERFSDAKLLADLPTQTTETAPATTTEVKPGPPGKALLLLGLHHQLFGVEGALARALPGCAIDSAYSRDAATSLEHLSDYGTLALIDYPLPTLMQRLAIANWVRGGGHLLVCGGQYTLAQANWGKTFLEDVLPATLQEAPDVVKLPAAAALGPAPTATFAGSPGVYYAQKVTPRPQARVLWWAGRQPILLQCAVGKGRTTLCAATVLGEAEKGGTPFWLWKGYSAALAAAIK